MPLITAPVVIFSEFKIVSFEKNVDAELIRESDAIFSIVSFELMNPPSFPKLYGELRQEFFSLVHPQNHS